MLPELPYRRWEATHRHLHLMHQVVGKVRLARQPRVNHWWHVPFYATPLGLGTAAMPSGDGLFELAFDLRRHRLALSTSWGTESTLPLGEGSVGAFHRGLLAMLADAGIETEIRPVPFDPAKVGSATPFADDLERRPYDRAAVEAFADVLAAIEPVFQAFRGRFLGKSTPVHLFWHSMDLALTRFSGARAPELPLADPVTRDAYSHEVVSFGFWAGDPASPEPAFYAYAAPEPAGLAAAPLEPEGASWHDTGRGHLALYPYACMRSAASPREALLSFLESAYLAMATRAGWPVDELRYEPAYASA